MRMRMRMRMREDGGDEGSVGGGNFKILFQLNFRTREVKQTFSEEKKTTLFQREGTNTKIKYN